MTVYEIVTDKIIKQMEKGIIPWHKPWHGGMAKFNRVSKKGYSVLNQLLLPFDGEYATLKQWNELGGKVKAGEKGNIVTYWNFINKTEKQEDGTEKVKSFPILRYYTVFHISQVEGVKPLENVNFANMEVESAEDVKNTYFKRESCRLFVEKSDRAYYSPSFDEVHVPELNQFENSDEFYSTLFHEMTHSTGASIRLDRLSNTAFFGSEDYSKEELVAEIGSAMLSSVARLNTEKTFNNSVAYLQSWLKALKNDPRMIVSAASKAEKAVDYILYGTKEAA